LYRGLSTRDYSSIGFSFWKERWLPFLSLKDSQMISFGSVLSKLRVFRPRAIPHVAIDEGPLPPVIPGVLGFCMTALCLGRAASVASPDEVVGVRVEVDDLRSEGVWWSRGFGSDPCSSSVGCVEGVGIGDEVGTVVRVFMVVDCKEAVFRVDLRPAVIFVAGLPHGVAQKTNQDGFHLGRCQNERDTASIERQRCDSSYSEPPIGEVTYITSSYPNTSTSYPSQSTFQHHPPLPPFQARPPATLALLRASKREFRKQRFLRIHLRYPSTTSNPPCARFRIWIAGPRKRRRQLKYIHYMTQHVKHTIRESGRSLVLFSQAALHHGLSVVAADGETLCRPLKRPRSPSPPPPPDATLHVAPLSRYSTHDRHLIACALETRPKYRRRFD
jgi:hypothetical protein